MQKTSQPAGGGKAKDLHDQRKKKITERWLKDEADEGCIATEDYDIGDGDDWEDDVEDGEGAPFMETPEDRKKSKHRQKFLDLAEACREHGEEEEALKWDKKAASCPKPDALRHITDQVDLNKAILRKEEIKHEDMAKMAREKKAAE